MKKHSLITQIMIWFIVLIVAGGTLVYAIGHEMIKGVLAFDNRYENSELIIVDNKSIAQRQIREINIDFISQGVNIYSTEEQDIRIEHRASRDLTKREKLIISTEENRLTIKKPRQLGINLLRETVNIYIPKEYTHDVSIKMTSGRTNIEGIELENLTLNKTSGSTDIADVEVEKLAIDMTSGSLQISNSQIAHLIGSGTSGSVRISDIISESIDIQKGSGSVKIEGICQELDVNSTSGSIVIKLDNMPRKVKTVQTSGSNKIELPENDGFELKYKRGSGNLTSDFSLNGQNKIKESGTYIYKDGSSKIDIKTTSGSTTISRR